MGRCSIFLSNDSAADPATGYDVAGLSGLLIRRPVQFQFDSYFSKRGFKAMRMLPILVLAVAGCGGTNDSTPVATTDGDTSITTGETGIALPDATASLIKFTMPGMT